MYTNFFEHLDLDIVLGQCIAT